MSTRNDLHAEKGATVHDRPAISLTWGVKFDEEAVEPIALDDGGGELYEEQVDAQLAAAAAQVTSTHSCRPVVFLRRRRKLPSL